MNPRPSNYNAHRPNARVIDVIEIEFIRGDGLTDDTPVRKVYAYYAYNGRLLGEHDTINESRLGRGLSEG